jgi:hypothetical protein
LIVVHTVEVAFCASMVGTGGACVFFVSTAAMALARSLSRQRLARKPALRDRAPFSPALQQTNTRKIKFKLALHTRTLDDDLAAS